MAEESASVLWRHECHVCAVNNLDGDYPDFLAPLASDQKFYLEPVFDVVPKITESEIVADGQITQTRNGYDVNGKLMVDTGTETGLEFTDANLSLEFSSEGDLLAMNGITTLPITPVRRKCP